MPDYRIAIDNCLRVYGSNAVFLTKALQTLIETSVENERSRLTAEAEARAKHPVCPQCKQALELEKALIAGESAQPLKRKRGRPRKNPLPA